MLIRRVLTQEEATLWTALSPAAQHELKAKLVSHLINEPDPSIRRKICDTVAETAMMLLDEDLWPELLPQLFEFTSSGSEMMKEAGFMIFEMLAMHIAEAFIEKFSAFCATFQQTISSPHEPTSLRLAASRAAGAVITQCEAPSAVEEFFELCAPLMGFLEFVLTANDVESTRHILSILIDIADTHPAFFRGRLQHVISSILAVASNQAFDNAVRRLCVEFCLTLAEKSPSTVRRLPENGFLTSTLPVVFGMMLEIDETAETWEARGAKASDEVTNFAVGAEALDRLIEVRCQRCTSC